MAREGRRGDEGRRKKEGSAAMTYVRTIHATTGIRRYRYSSLPAFGKVPIAPFTSAVAVINHVYYPTLPYVVAT